MKTAHGEDLKLIVLEKAGRNLLVDGLQKSCKIIDGTSNIDPQRVNIVCIDPDSTVFEAEIRETGNRKMVVAGVNCSAGFSCAPIISDAINGTGAQFAIAEQSIGSPRAFFSAGQILTFVNCGVMAIFNEYDLLADPLVLQLLIEHYQRSGLRSTLVGEPARRVKALVDEVQLEWCDPDGSMVFRPEITFRVACALTLVPEIPSGANTRQKVAYELTSKGWFPYNEEDTRKAVGSLTGAWGLHSRNLYLLPQEARKRGFPHPNNAQVIYDFIESIDLDPREITSTTGEKFDILYIYDI